MGKKFKEAEDKEDKKMPAKADAPGVDKDHADADQDKQMFAQMVKQYLGKDDADEAEMEMSKHAYQSHREGGMGHDEAYEAAGKHLAMAAQIGKKMHQAMEGKEKEKGEGESESEAEGEKHESKGESESESECKEKDDEDKDPKDKKESAAQVAKLSGEIAKLRECLKTFELRDHLDAKLKESKVSNQVTKLFRETLGKPKSKSHIDETWSMFIKAYKAGAEEVSIEGEGFFLEKSTYRATESTEKKDSLIDCLR